jgi:glycosyltransferase involved in cell wall biosynthesis
LAALSERADPVAVTFIPNGVDPDRFQPPAQRPPEPFRFLFVGRLNDQKDVGLLLAAVAELSHSAKRPFRLSIVGDGPLRGSLRQRATSLGIDGLVDWLDWLPREQMPSIYQSAHCVVNPSHYEGMPNVILEAMACAIPVIVSDVAGNRDVVEDGKSGMVVPRDSREGLVKAMARALREQPYIENLGACARNRVVERYSWDVATLQYIKLLERGIESKTLSS